MKRKLLSMLMALVMVIGLLPTAVFAAEVATIDSVAITVAAPVHGESYASPAVTLPEEANYTLHDAGWYSNGSKLTDGTFIAGQEYLAVLHLKVNDEAAQKFSEDVTATVNGVAVASPDGTVNDQNNGVFTEIQYKFTAVPATISEVAITVATPYAGLSSTAPAVTLPTGADYELYSAGWYSGGSKLESVTFVPGQEYLAIVTLKVNDDSTHKFSENVTAKVNDIPVESPNGVVNDQNSGRYAEIQYTFTSTLMNYVYVITEGANSNFTVSTIVESWDVKANAELEKFQGVEVDGVTVDPANYETESGSTIVKLKKSYLETLSAGEHILEMLFSDGSAGTTFTIADEEVTLKTVTIPVHKFVTANVAPGAKDFTVSMKLLDANGGDVSEEMDFVVKDNVISTDGEHLANNYTEESISFTVPADKYDELLECTLEVKENAIDEKGWTVDSNTITVSFASGATEGELTFDCDGSVLDNLNYIYLSNTYEICKITIPVVKTVRVNGNGTAPAADFEIDVEFPYAPDDFELGEDAIEATIETDGAGTYVDSVTITMTQSEFEAVCTEGTFAAILSEVNDAEDGWDYSPLKIIALASGWVVNSLDEGDLEVPAGTISTESAAVFSYYPYVDDDIDENHKLNYPMFENTYTVPIPVVITIPVVKTVRVNGNGTAPAETFQFDVEFPYAPDNFELGEGAIEATIETNGAGTYVNSVTITMTQSEFEAVCTEGTFAAILSEVNDAEDGWDYSPLKIIALASGWVVNSLGEGELEVPAGTISTESAAVFSYYPYVDGDIDENHKLNYPMFENTYTAPVNYTIKIPFAKKVDLGGNAGPGKVDFEFELLTPFYQGELDMKVEGTTVETNGKGTYEGELTITVAEEDLGNLTEGMVLVEKNTGASNWTYDDTAWLIGLSFVQVNSLDEDRASTSAPSYELSYVKAEKVEGDDGDTYQPTNDRADKIVFTNTYTKTVSTGGGGGSSTPSKPVLNKEDHFAFLAGYTDGTFGPERNMTRGEVATMFARLLTDKMDMNATYENSFSDVPADYWAYNFIGYVQKFGLISGYSDGTFRPNAPITRAEFATIACRFEELTEGTKTFSDVPETYWAYRFICYAAERGWVSGYTDGTFKPDNYITRAEVVTVTCRLLERNADKDYIKKNIDDLKTFPDVDEDYWAYWFVMEATNGHDYTKKNDKETWSSLHK